jgi:hypothetical protein
VWLLLGVAFLLASLFAIAVYAIFIVAEVADDFE